MNNNNEVIKQYQDKYPGLGSYMECMSRAFMSGLVGFGLSFGVLHFGQRIVRSYVPYSLKASVLVTSITSSVVAYRITSEHAGKCQSSWVATEERLSTQKSQS